MRLSLLHKGLLLVSIPLCFELAIFSVLLAMQEGLAREAARINKSRMISDAVNNMSQRVVTMNETASEFKNPFEAAAKVRASTKGVIDQLHLLNLYTKDDPKGNRSVQICLREAAASQQDFIELKQVLASSQFDKADELGRSFRPRFAAHLRNIARSGVLELGAASVAELDTDKTSAMRSRMVFVLKCAVASSALIGIFGALAYSRHLILRMQKVVSNADRLGKRQPLLARIGGNDEVADLDGALHEAERLIRHLEQARQEVISMVSHDIRSPLTTIRYSSEALEDQLHEVLNDSDRKLLGSIGENCDRILRISKDLLDIQRLESGLLVVDKTKTDLKDCLMSAVAATEGMRRNRSISIESDLDSIVANVDAGRIEQVVTNLITNAIKHSPRDGVVRLALHGADDGRRAEITVSDSGRGVPDRLKAAIFDRFMQVDSSDARHGTGLGLAISKALVELHGGEIGVDNLTPVGSKFWIRLPV